jgi:pimeloyl-ACP methyl ester carboxylesterase
VKDTVRRVGVLAGGAGLVAAGTAVGLAAERYAIGRIRHGPDSEADQPFGRLRADRTRTVVASDGVPLAVEEVGPLDAPLTVLFVHGYTLNMGSWHYQRTGLADMRSPRLRMVFYDQRSHGRSGRAPTESATIEQLGDDLDTILNELAPRGPVVLCGHSMGGMTVMALVDAHPEYFGSRIVGVALLSTSTGRLSEVTLGLPAALARLRTPIMPLLLRGMKSRTALIERTRRIGTDVAWLLTRKYSFGSAEVSPTLVEYVGAMIAATPVDVIADFYRALHGHDKLAALPTLRGVETLIVVGEKDLLTPAEHSQRMAELLPAAELLVIPDTGHLAMMEAPAPINLRLRAFVQRSARAAGRQRRKA